MPVHVHAICRQKRSNMPTMPRCDKRAQKIAFAIIGKPANMRDGDNNEREQAKAAIKERLDFEETAYVR